MELSKLSRGEAVLYIQGLLCAYFFLLLVRIILFKSRKEE